MLWAVAAALLIAPAAFLLWTRSRLRARLARFFESAGAEPRGWRASGTHDGTSYRLQYQQGDIGGGGISGRLRIILDVRHPLAFRIRRRHGPEVEQGPVASYADGGDENPPALEIQTGTPAQLESYFERLEVQRAVRKLFELGFAEIRLGAGSLEARRGFDPGGESDSRFVLAAVSYLATLADRLPDTLWRRAEWRAGRALLWSSAASLAAGALLVAAASAFPPVRWAEALRVALPWAGGAWAVGVAALLRGGRASFPHRLLIALSGLAVACASAASLTLLANGIDDPGPPAVYGAAIERVDDIGTLSFARVQSWRAGGAHERIRLPAEVAPPALAGRDRLLVVTKPGRLGVEWIVSVSKLDSHR